MTLHLGVEIEADSAPDAMVQLGERVRAFRAEVEPYGVRVEMSAAGTTRLDDERPDGRGD